MMHMTYDAREVEIETTDIVHMTDDRPENRPVLCGGHVERCRHTPIHVFLWKDLSQDSYATQRGP